MARSLVGCERGGHSSWARVAPRLAQPTRMAGPETVLEFPPRHPYSVLLPVGFALPFPLPATRWALTPPFHPYLAGMPALVREPGCRRGGLLSVALSLGSPPPVVDRHRVSMEPGLSSPAAFRRLRVRPPGRLTGLIKDFCPRNARARGPAYARWSSSAITFPQYLRDTGFMRFAL
jgi:hypothetical protein